MKNLVKVKSLQQSKENYKTAAASVPAKYRAGIQGANWKEAAESDEAEELYAQKVQEAIQAKRRKKGIQNVSNEEWKQRALNKGAQQIGNAMAQSVDKWADGYAPYKDALESVNLPSRSADAMANIDNRLKPVVKALQAKKKEIKG